MEKILLNRKEIYEVIHNCYKTDEELINKFHVIAGSGLEKCTNRTVDDLIEFDVDVYKLIHNGEFVGYFGSKGSILAGFFIIPEKRKECTELLWNTVKEHFKGPFTIGIYFKNKRAKRFLEKQGCKLEKATFTVEGIGEIYKYSEVR